MLSVTPYAFGYLLPAMTALGLAAGGGWAWSTVAFAFVVTPVLDAIVPLDIENPNEAEVLRRQGGRAAWDALLVGWLPVQVGLMVWTVLRLVHSPEAGVLEVLGWTVSLGVMTGGGGITVAHELMHRKNRFHRAVSELLMSLVLYPHFCVEHILGHHRSVATPADPASARRGESLWQFLPRTVIGGWRSAQRLETARVGAKKIAVWSDRRIRHPLLMLGVVGFFVLTGTVVGLAVLVAQAVIAVFLLEAINYVEHYGLRRHELSPGRFERVRPEHSWNSAHRVTGWYLFNLPRHSDHHYLASRPYPLLRHYHDAPQLPAGYSTMVLLAAVPPLWFRVMDPLVDHWNASKP